MPEILSVDPRSPASKAGIKAGDWLLDIDGHKINDVLDYNFRITEPRLSVRCHRGADILTFDIRKERYADLGLNFSNYLMDKQRRCQNKCIFCFIDQNPRCMRESVYFKDDDSRMSFLSGSYVTLTNMSDEDLDRIIEMKLSPVNVSVHTTDPDLRVRMMGNPRAAKINEQLKKLADGGVKLHCQIVLCRDINDGEALLKTMTDLAALYPACDMVGVVPCGLTKHREGLPYIRPFDSESSAQVIAQVSEFSDRMMREHGERVFFAGDEAYIKASLPLPPADYYEGFRMIEDGIGLMASMAQEIDEYLACLSDEEKMRERDISAATGEAAFEYIKEQIGKITAVCPGVRCRVYRIKNEFFGGEVTVAGLLTGADAAAQLKGRPLGDELILPAVSLRYERDRFLDDMTADELANALGTKLLFAENSGESFVRAVINGEADTAAIPGSNPEDAADKYINEENR